MGATEKAGAGRAGSRKKKAQNFLSQQKWERNNRHHSRLPDVLPMKVVSNEIFRDIGRSGLKYKPKIAFFDNVRVATSIFRTFTVHGPDSSPTIFC